MIQVPLSIWIHDNPIRLHEALDKLCCLTTTSPRFSSLDGWTKPSTACWRLLANTDWYTNRPVIITNKIFVLRYQCCGASRDIAGAVRRMWCSRRVVDSLFTSDARKTTEGPAEEVNDWPEIAMHGPQQTRNAQIITLFSSTSCDPITYITPWHCFVSFHCHHCYSQLHAINLPKLIVRLGLNEPVRVDDCRIWFFFCWDWCKCIYSATECLKNLKGTFYFRAFGFALA